MRQFEYRAERIDTSAMFYSEYKEGRNLWSDLDELGEKGWELVTVKWEDGDEGQAIFKREKEQTNVNQTE